MHQNDRITCWSDSAPPLVSPLTELQQAGKEVDFRIDVHNLLPVVKTGHSLGVAGGGGGGGWGCFVWRSHIFCFERQVFLGGQLDKAP